MAIPLLHVVQVEAWMPIVSRLTLVRTVLGLTLFFGFVYGVYTEYRVFWEHKKRLREVTTGRLYRSGQMTASGFRDAIREHGIKCIVNLQNEDEGGRDLVRSWIDASHLPEAELCKELGVRYIQLAPDLVPRSVPPGTRPAVIEEMLSAYDDPQNFPMLIHCKAGLHRTGILAAIYRMEYEGWTPDQAYRELALHGFGKECHEANDYVREYVLEYRPGVRLWGKSDSALSRSALPLPPTTKINATTPPQGQSAGADAEKTRSERNPIEACPCSP